MDTFERNLETAQQELGMDYSQYVPVIYQSKMELVNVLSYLPNLLLLAFIIYSFRRASSAMTGGKSGRQGSKKGEDPGSQSFLG